MNLKEKIGHYVPIEVMVADEEGGAPIWDIWIGILSTYNAETDVCTVAWAEGADSECSGEDLRIWLTRYLLEPNPELLTQN